MPLLASLVAALPAIAAATVTAGTITSAGLAGAGYASQQSAMNQQKAMGAAPQVPMGGSAGMTPSMTPKFKKTPVVI